jgi:peptidoglycan L-alanyl-D-glutamate endopeptidase CwlK
MFNWGNRSKERMEGVNPLLIECATEALKISKHDMTIPWMGGVRTAEEQNAIFKEGNTQKDGFEKKSYHQGGNALDVIPVSGGYANDKAFRHFAACMFTAWQDILVNRLCEDHTDHAYRLEWGGHWQNFIDSPHWQIVKR